MTYKQTLLAALAALALSSASSFAQGVPQTLLGTPEQARTMLGRVVAEVNTNMPKAMAAVSSGENGLKEGDLYSFCIGPDGKVDAHPNPALIGTDVKTLKDVNGKPFGEEMLRAKEGQFTEVSYMWPRLGSTKPEPKVSYVTRIKDHICGVGYYKQAQK